MFVTYEDIVVLIVLIVGKIVTNQLCFLQFHNIRHDICYSKIV